MQLDKYERARTEIINELPEEIISLYQQQRVVDKLRGNILKDY